MSFPSSPLIERAFDRSRVRESIVLALFALGPLFAAQLGRITGHELENVRGALVGERDAYRLDDSLVALGLVSRVPSVRGELFELTELGRSEVKLLVARRQGSVMTWA